MAFAEEGSPAFFAGAFDIVQATYLDEPKVAEAFRTGKGVGWQGRSLRVRRASVGTWKVGAFLTLGKPVDHSEV
jgi:hypothetical protein